MASLTSTCQRWVIHIKESDVQQQHFTAGKIPPIPPPETPSNPDPVLVDLFLGAVDPCQGHSRHRDTDSFTLSGPVGERHAVCLQLAHCFGDLHKIWAFGVFFNAEYWNTCTLFRYKIKTTSCSLLLFHIQSTGITTEKNLRVIIGHWFNTLKT